MHDELEEGGPEDEEGVSPGGVHHGPLGLADDLGVEDLALVEVNVPLLPHPEEELLIILRIQKNDALTFGNRLAYTFLPPSAISMQRCSANLLRAPFYLPNESLNVRNFSPQFFPFWESSSK